MQWCEGKFVFKSCKAAVTDEEISDDSLDIGHGEHLLGKADTFCYPQEMEDTI